MLAFSQEHLESEDFTTRQGASGHLLTQAAAELQLANELLHIAADQDAPPTPTTRATRAAALQDALSTLEISMKLPVSQGLPLGSLTTRASRPFPGSITEAKDTLETAAGLTSGAILQHVGEFGGDLAWNLVFDTEWMDVIQGAALLRQDISDVIEELQEKISDLVKRALMVAVRTLLNVFDKLMAFLGVDEADAARQQVREWLEKVREAQDIDIFERAVGGLYRIAGFKQVLGTWLADTSVDEAVIHEATKQVDALSDQFIALVGRFKGVDTALGVAKLVKLPQVSLAATGIQIALLAVLVYAGHDYIGYKEPPFPNITKGVAEIIQEILLV
jgi:hypothetical protein